MNKSHYSSCKIIECNWVFRYVCIHYIIAHSNEIQNLYYFHSNDWKIIQFVLVIIASLKTATYCMMVKSYFQFALEAQSYWYTILQHIKLIKKIFKFHSNILYDSSWLISDAMQILSYFRIAMYNKGFCYLLRSQN